MIYISLAISCILFIELSILLGLNNTVKSLLGLLQHAAGVLLSKEYSDLEKEGMIRKAALDVFKATAAFIAKFAAVLLGLYLAYLLCAKLLLFSEGELIASLYSIKVILLLTLIAVIYFRLRNVVVRRLLTH